MEEGRSLRSPSLLIRFDSFSCPKQSFGGDNFKLWSVEPANKQRCFSLANWSPPYWKSRMSRARWRQATRPFAGEALFLQKNKIMKKTWKFIIEESILVRKRPYAVNFLRSINKVLVFTAWIRQNISFIFSCRDQEISIASSSLCWLRKI